MGLFDIFVGIVVIIPTLSLCFIGGYEYAKYDKDLVDMPVAMKIAKNLHEESKYNIHTWDCSNKSEELSIRLHQQGYSDTEYIGIKLNGTCHAIVSYTQYIEATSGRFINPNIDDRYSFNRTGCRNVTND